MRRLGPGFWSLSQDQPLWCGFRQARRAISKQEKDAALNDWNNDQLQLIHRGISEVISCKTNNDGISLLKSWDKETNSMTSARSKTETDPRNFNVEDYPHLDPTSNSKATIRNGQIEHGAPLIPYIPRPTPPASSPRCTSGSAPVPHNPPDFPPPPLM